MPIDCRGAARYPIRRTSTGSYSQSSSNESEVNSLTKYSFLASIEADGVSPPELSKMITPSILGVWRWLLVHWREETKYNNTMVKKSYGGPMGEKLLTF